MLVQDDTDLEMEAGFGVAATGDMTKDAWLELVWSQSPFSQAALLRGNPSLGCEAEAVRLVLELGHERDSMMKMGNPSRLDKMRRGSLWFMV